MNRRQLLGLAITALNARAATRFDRSRLSILTDEIGTLDEAIAFAKEYRLKWVELRAYRPIPDAELKLTKKKLDDAGLGVSFFNSALLKYTLPGTVAVAKEDFYENLYKKEGLTPEKLYARREEDLKHAMHSAHALGVKRLRAFGFWRIADPASMRDRLVDAFAGMVSTAKKEGIEICLENEFSTNAGTTAETVAVLDKVPGLMLNWDPQNSVSLGDKVFPEGYAKLPKKRIANVQLKAEGLLGPGWGGDATPKPVDWTGIFGALARDGYAGCFGLETHTLKGGEINVNASHRSMKKMLELVGEKG